MSKFKVGDKVRFIENRAFSKNGCFIRKNPNYPDWSNKICIVSDVNPLSLDGYDVIIDYGVGVVYLKDNELELVESNNINSNMSIKQKFAELFMSEPNKSFRKAGITNSDYSLTTEGQDIFLQWLLKKNGDAFKTEVVDELLKEDGK